MRLASDTSGPGAAYGMALDPSSPGGGALRLRSHSPPSPSSFLTYAAPERDSPAIDMRVRASNQQSRRDFEPDLLATGRVGG